MLPPADYCTRRHTTGAEREAALPSPAYNRPVSQFLKVDPDAYEKAVHALLNTPPTPMADIKGKRRI
jgi:hypothetical protein